MPMPLKRRRGFTFVELVVVAAMVATGAALVPSAIQKAREAARRSSCKNNLKQIALAFHNYHETHVACPPGWVSKTPSPGAGMRFGWQAFLLPFVDHAPLYNELNFSIPPKSADSLTDRGGHRVLQTHLPVFRCPSDSTSNINPMRGNFGTSNYSGNFGDISLPRWTTGRQTEFWPGQMDTPAKANGIVYWNSNVRFRDITDGMSNTFMAGERSVTSAAGIWAGVGSNEFENDAVTDCSHGSRPNGGPTSFSSAHPNGVHFALCDGSVRFVDDGIDSQPITMGELGTYQRLANRHDGLVVDEY